jgi:hypothetical protein
LTDDPANDSTPACSPEGTKVAFTSTRNGVFGIYEVPLASAQAARAPLLATPTLLVSNALDADYSPDGQSLAYAGFNPATGIVDVFTRNLSTGAVTRLSSSSTPSVQNRLPTFFPADPGGVLWTTVTAVPARSLLTFEDDVTSNRPCDVIGRAARAQLGVIEFCLKAIEQAGAAVVQPIPVCACTELSVAVPNRGIGVGEAQSGGKRVTRFFVTVNWTLVCSGGIGVDCSGKLRLVSPGGGLSVSETRRLTKKGKKTISTKIKQPVDCSRRCNPAAQSKATGTVRVTLQSTKALSALAGKEFPVLKVIAECAGKQTTQEISVELSGSGRVKTIIWTSPE